MQWQEFRPSVRHLPARDISRIERAFVLGKEVHGEQKRKSGDPYFSHPIAVARLLTDIGADADTIIAALLHDTVEDTDLTLEQIDRLFDGHVAELIDGVTKLGASDVEGSPKLNEQVESLRKMFTLMQSDVRIMVIKLADRLHNMQTIEFLSKERREALARETLDIYVKIADRLCMQDLRDELESLCLSVLEPREFTKLAEMREENEQRGNRIIGEMRSRIQSHNRVLVAGIKMQYEYKRWEQIRSQIALKGAVSTGLPAVTVAFVCEDADTCYTVLGVLHQLWKREVLSFQDFINAPQGNGYQGLHTTIIAEDGTRVRCKIRSRIMHEYARRGIGTKCFDSKAQGIEGYLSWTKQITPLAADTKDSSDDFWQSLQSDILSEFITIHGMEDSLQIPRGSTALDGAFYLLGDQAAKTTSVKVNGVETPLDTVLENAVSVEVQIGSSKTCSAEWLTFVRTRLAVSAIHRALSALPTAQKVRSGEQILEAFMRQRQKGTLEEFSQHGLSSMLRAKGFPSVQQTFTGLAEGKWKATEVYEALFPPKLQRKSVDDVTPAFFRCTIREEDGPSVHDVISPPSMQAGLDWNSVRTWTKDDETVVVFTFRGTAEEMEYAKKTLEQAGVNVEWTVRTPLALLLTFATVILWGLHPVIVRWFLGHGIAPMTIFSLRLMTFGLCTTVFYAFWLLLEGKVLKRVPKGTRLAVMPSMAAAALAALTYEALLAVAPSLHLTILRCNTLLVPIVSKIRNNYPSLAFGSIALLFGAGILTLFRLASPGIGVGILLSAAGLLAYTEYSVTVEHTMQRHSIGFRYPAFLFRSGLLLLLLGAALATRIDWNIISLRTTELIVAYTVIFVFVPHALYTMLLQRMKIRHLTDYFFLEPPIAILGELVILGIVLPLWAYAAMGGVLLSIMMIRRSNVFRANR